MANPLDDRICPSDTHTFASHLYIRAPQLQFDEILARLQGDATVRHVHIYCDRLTCKDVATLSFPLPAAIRTVHIFARDFLSTVQNLREIVIEAPTVERRVLIVYEDAPPGLLVRFSQAHTTAIALTHDARSCPELISTEGGQVSSPTHDHITSLTGVESPGSESDSDPGKADLDPEQIQNLDRVIRRSNAVTLVTGAGRLIRLSPAELAVQVIKDVSPHELEQPQFADVKCFGVDIARTRQLPKLLYHLLVSATSSTFAFTASETKEVISRLRYIVKCARSSAAVARLAADAQRLLDVIELPARDLLTSSQVTTRYYVPNLEPEQYLKSIVWKIQDLQRAEDSIASMDWATRSEGAMARNFEAAFQSMGKIAGGFIDRTSNRDAAVKAIFNCERQQTAMRKCAQACQDAGVVFDQGVADYQEEKRKEMSREMLKCGLKMIFHIGVAVATCGAGGPLTIGSLAKAQEAIKHGVRTMDKVKTAMKKIIEAAGRLVPKMMAAWQGQSGLNGGLLSRGAGGKDRLAISEALQSAADKIRVATLPEDMTATIDYFGILADWEEFDQQATAMFAELQRCIGEDSIRGMTEYCLALRAQAIRGRTVILAMREVQETSQYFYRQEVEYKSRMALQAEMTALAQRTTEGSEERAAMAECFRWSLTQQTLAARTSLYIRTHRYLLSLIYSTNKPDKIRQFVTQYPLQSDSPTRAFSELAHALSDFHDDEQTPENTIKDIRLSTRQWTGPGKIFASDWETVLRAERQISFSIPWNRIGLTANYHRVRILHMKVEFKGLEVPAGKSVLWRWDLGPQFIDKDANERPILYYMPVQSLQQIQGEGTWLDKHYKSPNPSLFCRGRITFVDIPEDQTDGSFDTDAMISIEDSGVDLSNVSEVILSFECVGLPFGTDVTLNSKTDTA